MRRFSLMLFLAAAFLLPVSCASLEERRLLSFFAPCEVLRIDRPKQGLVVMHFAVDRDSTTLVGYVEDCDGHRHARLWINDWTEREYPADRVAKFLDSRPSVTLFNPTPEELARLAEQ